MSSDAESDRGNGEKDGTPQGKQHYNLAGEDGVLNVMEVVKSTNLDKELSISDETYLVAGFITL